jgi:site-specific DNA-cytosine methylase
MRFLSVCSGIEAASVAWNPLGWEAVAFSEIEPFPCAVLAHHYPDVPNWGDMTKFQEWPDAAIDLLCGGTPCQSFSVAGLRKGLDDPRGNLMLTFGAIAARYRPRWLVWENVPGVLSSNGGRDFGSFLGLLGVLGYGFAYRVLDAQFAGVPQRRRRVFVVGCLGDWASAAAVLLERHSLSGHPAPSRQARERVAAGSERGFAPSSFGGYSEGVGTLRKDGGDYGGGTETIIAGPSMCLNAKGGGGTPGCGIGDADSYYRGRLRCRSGEALSGQRVWRRRVRLCWCAAGRAHPGAPDDSAANSRADRRRLRRERGRDGTGYAADPHRHAAGEPWRDHDEQPRRGINWRRARHWHRRGRRSGPNDQH